MHNESYCSLIELCDQAVQVPKRARKKKKNVIPKSGSTSYNSLLSDSEVSIKSPKKMLPGPANQVDKWRMSLFDMTTEILVADVASGSKGLVCGYYT